MRVKLVGLDDILRRYEGDVVGKPLRAFWRRVGIAVQSKARTNLNERAHDMGHLVNTIQYEVDERTPPLFVRVGVLGAEPGSPLWFKARAMEFGTGRMGDPEVSHKSSHNPPAFALERWAELHGIQGGGYIVARAIARRGGLRPRRWLRDAAQQSMNTIRSSADRLAADIRKALEGGA